MQTLCLLLFILQAATPEPATNAQDEGWTGNQLLQDKQFEAAQGAYQRGLSLYQDGRSADEVYYGLQNNLGLALHGQGDFEQAQTAFSEAVHMASDPADLTRSHYNAGNNLFNNQSLDAALEQYRQALIANPSNEDARFNYEYAKRLQQQQQQQNQEDQEQNQEQNQDQNQENQEGEQQQDQDEQQDNQNQSDENQESENQDSQEQEQQQSPEQEPQEQQPQEAPLSRAEAERILKALENGEKELLREVQKVEGRPRRVTKDW